jgi:predicted metal-dependent phosphoesterase TrpH
MLNEYAIDLHIHSALSPCAEAEMTPRQITAVARDKGIDIIAITDHNTAANAAPLVKAGAEAGLTVIPGMEVQTLEEVHIVCLFATVSAALDWQKIVYQCLPAQENREAVFGPQLLMDENDQITGRLNQLLLTSTNLSLEQVLVTVGAFGGVCIPAHIDRPAYSLIGNLGFIPPNLPIKAVEISRNTTARETLTRFPALAPYTIISSSDAHRLAEINSRSLALLAAPTFTELVLALKRENGRQIITA